MQPVLYLVLFGPLLKPLADQFGAENAYTFFVPGLLVQLGIFGAFFAGFRLIARVARRASSRPSGSPRPAAPRCWSGRLLRDVLQLFVQALILVGLGYVRRHARRRSAAWSSACCSPCCSAAACAAASNALALTTKSEDVMAPVINMVMMPVLLLSGILLPMTIGPDVAAARPATSCRSAGSSTPSATPSWATSPAAACSGAPLWALVLFALAALVGHATFRKENA